jgi:hypothetical protein
VKKGQERIQKEIFYAYILADTSAPAPFHDIGQDRGNLNLPAFAFILSFNKFRVQSEHCRVDQVILYKIHLQPSEYI